MESYQRTLQVVPVNDYEVVTALAVGELLDICVPGRAFLPRAKNDPVMARLVRELWELHEMIQRDLTGRKLANAEGDLKEYVRDQWLRSNGKPAKGILPTITLYFPDNLGPVSEQLKIAAGTKGLLLDGESRVEAMLYLIEDEQTPKEIVDRLYSQRLPVHILHNIEPQQAASYFVDINGRGVQINANLLVARDLADEYGQIAARVFKGLEVELEGEKRQVGKKDTAVLTVLQARLMVAAIAHGVGAIQYGAKRIPLETKDGKIDQKRLEKAARTWLEMVFKGFGADAFKDKGQVLRSVPVLISIGALGRGFYTGSGEEQGKAHAFLADRKIDWSADRHWNGVCGKVNPTTERFSVGSGKEYAYATYKALMEKDSPAGKQIRTQDLAKAS